MNSVSILLTALYRQCSALKPEINIDISKTKYTYFIRNEYVEFRTKESMKINILGAVFFYLVVKGHAADATVAPQP
jgi:hypothetical protein